MGDEAAMSTVHDKLIWTLIGPESVDRGEFRSYVLEDLAPAAGNLVEGTVSVKVTLQEPNAFCGATVRIGDRERRIDAVLQIASSRSYVAIDPVNSVLSGACFHVQGWRAHETVILDRSAPAPAGTPVAPWQLLWINQRMDGKTPEFYDKNWYVHAGHLDGREEESTETKQLLDQWRSAPSWEGLWYVQNRVREPITPTAWVVNGMSDYLSREPIPGPGERYNPKDGHGEDSFDRWPPRVVQGRTYIVA
jgi:hypothetical protein